MFANNIENIEKEDTSSDEVITQPFAPSDIKLTTPPMNLGDLIDMIQYNWINFETDYQREQNLWDPQRQSRLIESVLLGLRLPAFYFEEVNKKQWNIIDGLQRCSTIRNFCVDGTLTLTNLEFQGDSFNGKRYEDFSFEIKRDIRMLPITVNLLNPGVPDKVKYILFKRLNTGGINLEPQEIRNAMYRGKAINIIKEMAVSTSFIKATSNKIPTLRKEHMDFISRFVAFYLLHYTNYQPDLENFINNSMEILKSLEESEILRMKNCFESAMQLSWIIFGKDAFRKQESLKASNRKPINKAYFEVISSSFSSLNEIEKETLINCSILFKENLCIAMKNCKPYNEAFSTSTSRRDKVLRRHDFFREIINKSINGIKIKITDDNRIENSEL